MVTHHSIDYIELGAPDVAAAKAFYAAAFGWEFTDYGPDYAGIQRADGDDEMGGLNGERAGGAGGPLVLLRSDDLAAAEQAVRDAGGTISTAPYAYPGGRRFMFTDLAGNELGVYQPE
ncbi:VOC family protein [Luteipulveratus flavus]|uniref:VOC family protein n=1 Tax=Luteipulveratus flavus TaxID=3031728 RepID=A0ABT6C8N8_9MICO|nr:VOC family protein [Luteipulveratus sp. YIM 133296]MDF8265294.1 VOC family protein [Luteipulveratus sp. YIM 133296]